MRVRVGEDCWRVSGRERQGCGKCCWGEGISMVALRGGQVRNMNDVFMIGEVWQDVIQDGRRDWRPL